MGKVVIYLRVSCNEQTTENQLPALEKWIDNRGHELVEVYRETESAWRDGHQKELRRLRQDATRGKFDIVLIWSLDRLSREGPLKVLQLVQSFQFLGVKLISYQEAWTQVDGPMTELLYSLTAWVGKYESDRRSERTLAGLARAKAQAGGKLPRRGPDKRKRKHRTPRQPLWEVD
jgi:putative DNA-invertase from lambdoid prophage Rac